MTGIEAYAGPFPVKSQLGAEQSAEGPDEPPDELVGGLTAAWSGRSCRGGGLLLRLGGGWLRRRGRLGFWCWSPCWCGFRCCLGFSLYGRGRERPGNRRGRAGRRLGQRDALYG
ncbi:hypothetical protein ACWD0A_23590 [Streptomyces sp. NPDC002867]